MRALPRIVLSIVGAAFVACTASTPGAAPMPRPNTWVVSTWQDSASKQPAVARLGIDTWIRVRLDSVALDTAHDSIARAAFHLVIRCLGCVFYLRSSSAVDDDGELWRVSNMPNPIRQTPDGLGWVVSRLPRELNLVYAARLAGRGHLPSTLALSIRTRGGMVNGANYDPLTGMAHFYPTWIDTITFPRVTLAWLGGGRQRSDRHATDDATGQPPR